MPQKTFSTLKSYLGGGQCKGRPATTVNLMSEVNLRTTLSSMKCKVPSNGEMANSEGQLSWTSEAALAPSQGMGFHTADL